jgi:hypothetical protein
MTPTRALAALAAALLLSGDRAAAQGPRPPELRLTYDAAAYPGPFTGRVFVMLSAREPRGLISGIDWFNPEPIFAADVKDWKPGEPLVVGADALAYPAPLNRLKPGTWYAQAIMDLDRGSANFSAAEGNVYGDAVRFDYDPAAARAVNLKLDKAYQPRAFGQTERVKLVDVESKLLSELNKRPTRLRAGVVLPRSYNVETDRAYPVVYEVPGFGGDHFAALSMARSNVTDVAGVEMLWVVLDPNCRLGHHVFADSANNGPVGRALTEELIPHIEKTFRAVGKPSARFVTGHSSGGWSSLWLQVAYPDFFNGTWSTAPDPVDFRDFQRIDLYAPGANMFTGPDGKQRPIARSGARVLQYYKPFSDMEEVIGHGGQLGSFEAVFSPKGPDGRPRRLWDRKTGAVDPEVAKEWQKYDIRLVLERNWKELGPKLQGKVHVYMGGEDTFYLDGAARLLGESLRKLGGDAVVEVVPGKNHFTLMDGPMRRRIAQEMAERFKATNKVE